MKYLLYNLFCYVAIILVSCKQIKSDQANLLPFGVKIKIVQDPKYKSSNEITVNVYNDRGKTINSDKIKIKVNNKPIDFQKKQELYYITTTRYYIADVPVNETYYFEITLENGKKYALASIKPLKAMEEKNISIDNKGDLTRDLSIKWNNLPDVNKLTIQKTIRLNESAPNIEQIEYSAETVKQIHANGSYTIPKSYFTDAKSKISTLELTFSASKTGTVNPKLLKLSTISAESAIKQTVPFN